MAQSAPNVLLSPVVAEVTPEGPSHLAAQGEKCVCAAFPPTPFPPVLSWAVQGCVVVSKHHQVAMSTNDWTTWLDRLTAGIQTWLASGLKAAMCGLLVAST